MTKIELMDYCWSRYFSFKDVLDIASRTNSVDVPCEEEYKKFSSERFEGMLKWLDNQYEDWRSESQRAKDELSHNLQKPYNRDDR